MIKILNTLLIVVLLFSGKLKAQITITSTDMPVAGDTLYYSIADPASTSISLADTGAGMTWAYSIASIGHGADTYQTALAINPAYILIGLTAYGYKVADSFPIPIPLPGVPAIKDMYTFFEKRSSPSRYQAQAFAANIGGLPTPINYSKPDVWYFFPLNYLRMDSSNFTLNITLPVIGSLKRTGYRKTRVDGWGTITTPYYTTPVNCLRVRSEIHEIDSIPLGPLSIGFPVNTVEYKWLVKGDHYPALWVTTNMIAGGMEQISSVRYRDAQPVVVDTTSGVANVNRSIHIVKAVPNPSTSGKVTLQLPEDWKQFDVSVFNTDSKLVSSVKNERELDLRSLPVGTYFIRVTCGEKTGYTKITR
jgi:hypothetical protein